VNVGRTGLPGTPTPGFPGADVPTLIRKLSPPKRDSSKGFPQTRSRPIAFTPYTVWERHCDLVTSDSDRLRRAHNSPMVKLAAHTKIQVDAATRDRHRQ